MPRAAVPEYLGSDFSTASPALRFGMYLKLWGIDFRSKKNLWATHDVNNKAAKNSIAREFKDENKTSALNAATPLNESERESMAAHAKRQQTVFQATGGGNGLELIAQSVAPFTTGLGNEHPLENGFAFLNPYGLPYLPGSSVKGTVRRAAEELAHPDFFRDDRGWTLPSIWLLFGFEPWLASRKPDAEWEQWIDGFSVSRADVEAYLDAVLDETSAVHEELKRDVLAATDPRRALLRERRLHVRGALEFWDVVPQIDGKALAVEIMTPHQSHYYQNQEHAGSVSPHDSGKPNPIPFLTVPPGSEFVFHVRCDRRRLPQNLAADDRWRALLSRAFEHAFEWLGFGAKTAVGYGAMARNREGERQARQDRANQEYAARERAAQEESERKAKAREEARLAVLPPIEREIETVLRDRPDRNVPEITCIMQAVRDGCWTGEAKLEVAAWLKNRMESEKRWRETSQKKNPAKDFDHQKTLRVRAWLAGDDG